MVTKQQSFSGGLRATRAVLVCIAVLVVWFSQFQIRLVLAFESSTTATVSRDQNDSLAAAIMVPSNATQEFARKNCSVVKPPEQKPNNSSKPIWIPAYPGSGSEMFRSLVLAATGLGGGEIYARPNCRGNVATCKTHWPALKYFPPQNLTDRVQPRAILLIRNPMDALPSFFNHIYEQRKRIGFHSQQAPESEWQTWRNRRFNDQIDKWKAMFLTWREKPFTVAFYLQYEHLVSEENGPKLFSMVLNEVRKANFAVPEEEDVPCLWYNVVKKAKKMKRAPHKYRPGYTPQQQEKLLAMLESLIEEFEDKHEVVAILQEYVRDVNETSRIDQPKPATSANAF